MRGPTKDHERAGQDGKRNVAVADQQTTAGNAVSGLVYGLLIGWAVGMLWWTSLVFAFGLEPSVVSVVIDSTGRHETQVTVLERFALVPVRAIPWAMIAGVVGAVAGWKRERFATGERPNVNGRVVTGLAYGLLAGWIVGVLSWTSLAIAFGPTGDTYIHGGVKEVYNFRPVLETLADIRWTVAPWAVVGAVAGAIIGRLGGWLEAATSFLGMLGGICFALSNSPFDGWLALAMPICAFTGTGIGLAGGLLVTLVMRFIKMLRT